MEVANALAYYNEAKITATKSVTIQAQVSSCPLELAHVLTLIISYYTILF
jgi:hypothetical protein